MSFYGSKIQISGGLYSKDLSIYLLERNQVDKVELLNNIVEFKHLGMFHSERIW